MAEGNLGCKRTSSAQVHVRLSKAALDAAYVEMLTLPLLELVELMLMMRPPRGMCGTTLLTIKKGPRTFSWKTLANCSTSGSSVIGQKKAVPALLTIQEGLSLTRANKAYTLLAFHT